MRPKVLCAFEYIEGVLALGQLPLGQDDLLRVGRMIRQIHDASEGVVIPNPDDWNMLLPAENPNLMCHNDLAPWNLIMGDRWVLSTLYWVPLPVPRACVRSARRGSVRAGCPRDRSAEPVP